MNEQGRPAGRPRHHITAAEDSTRSGVTPLQIWTRALFALLGDVRDELDESAYSSFVAIACERIGIEAARLAVGEALNATREAAEGEAA
jgi:hypothetical protein